jgi:hypothetical protein
VEITVPRANHLTIALPPFEVATRKQGVWVQVVEALRGEPELTAFWQFVLAVSFYWGSVAPKKLAHH